MRTLYEVCIPNAGKWVQERIIRKALVEAGVRVVKVKKQASAMAAFVHFGSEAERAAGMDKMTGMTVKGFKWTVRSGRSWTERWGGGGGGGAPAAAGGGAGGDGGTLSGAKRPRATVVEPAVPLTATQVADAIIPWHAVPYGEQLARKHAEMQGVLRSITEKCRAHVLRRITLPEALVGEVCRGNFVPGDEVAAAAEGVDTFPPHDARWVDRLPTAPDWEPLRTLMPPHLLSGPSAAGMQACPLLPIVPSPAHVGYRNKVELTIGRDAAGAPVAGHRAGVYAEGVTVYAVDGLANIPPQLRHVAAVVTSFLRDSPLPPYSVVDGTGVWRTVMLRLAEASGAVMVALTYFPRRDEAAVLDAELRRWVTVVSAAGSAADTALPAGCPPFTVASLYAQPFDGVSAPPPNHPFTHLHGTHTIVETVLGCRFEVSPGAFFQVNRGGAERLFSLVRDLARYGAGGPAAAGAATAVAVGASGGAAEAHHAVGSHVALVDVCCGTGTIGLACASAFARVVGVEMSAAAVEDARRNAALNGIHHATFVAAKAEDAMARVLELATLGGAGLPVTEVVGIVDPPRGGLHATVIRALRTCRAMKRLVYVSCNPTGTFIDDALRLTTPPDSSAWAAGPPFRAVVARAVDMFPDTPHTELVTLFERS